LLVLAGILLATATVNDVVRQAHVDHRLIADLSTWRMSTGHDYHNLTVQQFDDRRRLRQHDSWRSQNQGPDLSGNGRPDGRRPARGARRLVFAGQHRRRPGPLSLRLLRA